MKKLFLTLIIFFAIKAEAKKMVYPIEIVAGTAQIIVIGEIHSLKNNSYIFKIDETLKGKAYSYILVNMFEEWTCDLRFDKPKKGQKLCLFLNKEKSGWDIINGSTGERPIVNNSITLGSNEEYKHIDFKFTPYILPLVEFKKGIKEFCKCYKFVGNYNLDKNAYFKKIGNDEQALKFKSLNSFSAWLYKKVIKYPVKN